MRWLQVLRTLMLMGAVASVGYVVARQEVARELASFRASREYITPQDLGSLPGDALASPEPQAELPWLGLPDDRAESADTAVPPDQSDAPSEATAVPPALPADSYLAPSEAWPEVVVRLPPEAAARPGGFRLAPSGTWPGVAVKLSPEEAPSVDQGEPAENPQETALSARALGAAPQMSVGSR